MYLNSRSYSQKLLSIITYLFRVNLGKTVKKGGGYLDILKLREITEKSVALLDIYDKLTNQKGTDTQQQKSINYKSNFVKEKLLLNIIESKKLCENLIKDLENDMKN
jgi:hypothetical protein